MQVVALCVWAHPQNYPHIERHARALLEHYDQVRVYALFGSDLVLPQIAGVVWVRVAPSMPVGIKDFALYALRLWFLLGRDKPDAIEAVDPSTLMAAGPWCRWNRIPLLYFSMELWSELPSLIHRPWRRRLWSWIEKGSLPRRGLRIATVSSGVAHLLSSKLGHHVQVVRSIPPRPLYPELKKDLHREYSIPYGAKILVYQGLLEPGRGIEDLARAVALTQHWHLLVIGSGPADLELRAEFAHSERVYFAGRLPYDQSLEYMAGADAGAVYIQDLGLSFRHCMPGKLFEYAHRGLPVLVSPLPDLSEFVQQAQIGVVAKDWSCEALVEALRQLTQGIAAGTWQSSLSNFPKMYHWEKEGQKLPELLRAARAELEGEGPTQ